MKSILSRCSLALGRWNKNASKISGKTLNSIDVKIEDIIENYFNKREWYYSKNVAPDGISYDLFFNRERCNLMVLVDVYPEDAFYRVACHLDEKLSDKSIEKGLIEVNKFNQRAIGVCGFINSKGYIRFWVGRNINGNTFSEEAFIVDLLMCMKTTEEKTVEIFKQLHEVDANYSLP